MWVIDRIENGIAVIECNDSTFDVPVSALPGGVKEGMVLSVSIDKDAEDKKRQQARNLMDSMFSDE
ncbi:MAG: DUF3006 domain-containing protein [Clostridia bacterium]|nr:DUF3006 domain-containing protein [Clostridia bacterium]